MTVNHLYPTTRPTLDLNFARQKRLDPRVSFTRGSTATYVGDDGLIKTAASNEARFDHDPATGESLGLLVEESRTNYIADNSTITGWSATGTNAAVVASTTVCPDGSTDGIRITGSLANEGALKTFTAISATYIGSCYARSRTGSSQNVKIAFSGFIGITQTLPASGDWVRITGNPGVGLGAGSKYFAVRAVSDGTLDIDVWGEQAEVGTFPTSYIPTSGSTVTRSADVASMTGTNFSSWYNQSEGSLFYSFKGPGMPYQIHDSTSGNRSGLSTSTGRPYVVISGNTTYFGTSPTVVLGGGSVGYGYKANDYGAYGNGVELTGTSPTTVPAGQIELAIGFRGTHSPDTQLNGTISRIAYYPTRLTDSQLQELTR